MSFSAARHAFSAASRASLRAARSNASTVQIGAKRMNSSHAAPQSSDKPWIIVSGLIFGPAFLYLVSPSARKRPHFGHKEHEHANEAPAPVIMKDDEGTEANISASLQQAETADVPKAAGAEVTESEPAVEAQTTEPEHKETVITAAGEKSGTFQERGESGPTDLGVARKAATAGIEPKKAEDAAS
ncbi:hypothetical protein Hypma_000975 [Hypsizygus marmoreus]|uniref:Uncharacterized protein n=1 Tax=Hypsizygus marmoreus TaxID=39966 RepID=A0A369JFA6_HYPMA|nr:hypothetical protein Hypma_000975 [Hypsizygus marmoreus]